MFFLETKFLDILQQVKELMIMSIGPGGKGVLVSRKSPREIFITKSGLDIMETHMGFHPFMDIIIGNIKDLTQITGEGSKRTFLAICELIQILECKFSSNTRQEVVTMLSSAQEVLERDRQQESDREAVKYQSLEEVRKCVKNTIISSLACRVPPLIGTHLSELLAQFLNLQWEECRNVKALIQMMNTVICSFTCQVVEVFNKSIYESAIGEGTFIYSSLSLISSSLNFSKQKIAKNITFIILHYNKPDTSKVSLNLTGQSQTDIRSVSSSAWLHAGEVSGALAKAGVRLVIAPCALAPVLRQKLSEADIAAIEYTGWEEVKAISAALGVLRWGPGQEVSQTNIGCAMVVQSVVLGGQPAVRLVTQHSRSYHLVLAAPTKHLASQYSQGMLAALKCARLAAGESFRLAAEEATIPAAGESARLPTKNCDGMVFVKCSNMLAGPKGGECQVLRRLHELCRTHNCEALLSLCQSLTSWKGKLKPKDRHLESKLYEPLDLTFQVASCVLYTVKLLVRIERICPTSKRIGNLVKLGKRVGEMADSDSDED